MAKSDTSSWYKLYHSLGMGLAVFIMVIACAVLFGWIIKNATLIQVNPQFAPMQFNTALGFLISGIGLLAIFRNLNMATKVAGFLVFIIGFLTLLQYVLQVNFGIDELFTEYYIDTQVSHPGRMAPNTALCFVLTGLAVVWAVYKPSIYVESILASLVFALGLVAFTGYLIGVESAFGWGKLTRMAIHTSFCFILISLALIAKAVKDAINNKQQSFRWLVVPIAITGVTMSFMMNVAMSSQHLETREGDIMLITTYASEAILVFGLSLTALLCYILYVRTDLSEQKSNRISIFSTLYLGSLLAFSVFQYIEDKQQQTILQDFNGKAEKRAHAIEMAILPYFETLYTIQTAFHSAPDLSRSKFTELVTRSVRRYEGIIALEWLPKVLDENRSRFERQVQKDYDPNFQIFEVSGQNKVPAAKNRHISRCCTRFRSTLTSRPLGLTSQHSLMFKQRSTKLC